MNRKTSLLIILMAFFGFLGINVLFAQTEMVPEQVTIASPEMDVQCLWGDVMNIDLPNTIFMVKYFDYETETEKNVSVSVNNDTVYESVTSLDEIKPQDTVSVDYVVIEGNNIAKNVGVEKPEENPEISPKPEINAEDSAEQPVEDSAVQ